MTVLVARLEVCIEQETYFFCNWTPVPSINRASVVTVLEPREYEPGFCTRSANSLPKILNTPSSDGIEKAWVRSGQMEGRRLWSF